MKKILFFIALMIQSVSIFADNIYISDFSIKKGEVKTLEVIVENSEAIDGKPIACSITLPTGLSFDGTNASAVLTSRVTYYGSESRKLNNKGVLKLSAYTAQMAAGTGAVWTFKVKAADDFESGKISIYDKNVNGDESLASSETSVTIESDAPQRTDPLYISDFSIGTGKTAKLEVILNTTEAISGKPVACSITLPAGLSFDGTNANAELTDRVTSYGSESRKLNNKGVLKLSVYTAVIPAGTSAIWTFTVKAANNFEGGEIKMYDINVNGDESFEPMTIKVTADSSDGINNAIVNIENNAVVYNIAGQRVNANAKGIIIKNGKKFIAQ